MTEVGIDKQLAVCPVEFIANTIEVDETLAGGQTLGTVYQGPANIDGIETKGTKGDGGIKL